MNLRPHFIFDWDPVIFHNGRIYITGDDQEDGCMSYGRRRLGFVKLGNIDVYENNFFEHSKAEILAFQNSFLEAAVKRELRENDEAKRALEENAILSFIVREILPELTRQKEQEEINGILGVKESAPETGDNQKYLSNFITDVNAMQNNRQIEKLIRQIEAEYAAPQPRPQQEEAVPQNSRLDAVLKEALASYGGNVHIEYKPALSRQTESKILDILGEHNPDFRPVVAESKTDESIFGSLLQSPVAIIGGRVYNLVPAAMDSEPSAHIDGQRFGFAWWCKLPDLYGQYDRMLERKFKIEALRNSASQSNAFAQAQREREALRELLKTNNFEKAGVGFLKKGYDYYVYVETPDKYALQNSHGSYYLFDKARIAVRLFKERRIYADNPIILGQYHHPFIPGPGIDLKICLGEYHYDRTAQLPPLESVLTFLSDAKKVILAGYTGGGNPHRKLTEDYFRDNKVSEEYTRKNKIPVTNKSVLTREGWM